MTTAILSAGRAGGEDSPLMGGLLPPKIGLSLREFVEIWHDSQNRRTPDHWQWMIAWLHCMTERRAGRVGLLILAFRGAGKSTLTGFYAAWLLFCNPRLRIFLLAAEHSLAVKMSAHVRRVLETHPKTLAEVVPKVQRGTFWGRDSFTLRCAPSARDPSLMARGLEANITGNRADLIICDDVEVPNSSRNFHLQDKLRDRLDELQYIRVPDGATLYLGTPHSSDTIYSTQPDVSGQPALLGAYHRLVLPACVPDTGFPIWGEVYSREVLAAQEKHSRNFRAQMLLDLEARKEGAFALESLVRYDAELEYREANKEKQLWLCGRKIVRVACRWDPALGPEPGKDGRRRDSNVVAVVLKDEAGNWMLHRVLYIGDKPVSEPGERLDWFCKQVVDFCGDNYVERISVEKNGVGGFVPDNLREAVSRMGSNLIVHGIHESKPKAKRIHSALDPLLAAARFCVHNQVYKTQWIQEFRSWHPSLSNQKDDGLDAVASAILETPDTGASLRTAYGPTQTAHPSGAQRKTSARTCGKVTTTI